ncbi:THO complex subunit 2 [Platysternon megacephalum]|uniref:THO complex subunit 2 n=1 Tax=Platysternon megacephalum TaxID=55544 RepID=A0A4D9F5J5_9SAUR|nr:THO complex subunit 2 [Platysternon megacephalum]
MHHTHREAAQSQSTGGICPTVGRNHEAELSSRYAIVPAPAGPDRLQQGRGIRQPRSQRPALSQPLALRTAAPVRPPHRAGSEEGPPPPGSRSPQRTTTARWGRETGGGGEGLARTQGPGPSSRARPGTGFPVERQEPRGSETGRAAGSGGRGGEL